MSEVTPQGQNPAEVPAAARATAADGAVLPMAASAGQTPPPRSQRRKAVQFAELPPYSRSLLKIKVPAVVTLAEKRQPLRRIVELGPGSIIQFDKSCEEMLELVVGNRRVALGEAIKVGDKFGLRVTSMILPEERFQPVTRPQ